jgi:hypothetical protein
VSTVQIGAWRRPRESNRDDSAAVDRNDAARRVKRAILPAAISDSAAIRLLAKAGSREQSPHRRPIRSRIERDDHHEQNSAYSPFTPKRSMVPLAQSAERWSVEPEVTGSSPVRHPKYNDKGARLIQMATPLVLGRILKVDSSEARVCATIEQAKHQQRQKRPSRTERVRPLVVGRCGLPLRRR